MPDPGWVAKGKYEVRAHGFFGTIDSRKVVGLAHARIDLMDSDSDSDTLTDDLIGVGRTEDDGTFSVLGKGDDDWTLTPKPDVYVRVVLDDCAEHPVRCADELNSARYTTSPQHDHDNVDGDVDIGAFAWGNQNTASAPSVWQASRSAFLDYGKVTGESPPAGHYDIEYWSVVHDGTPWTNLDTTHWPRFHSTGPVNVHEFAHSVRHSFDGDQDHFNWDVVRFSYIQEHDSPKKTNEGFAFNEGWAEFWEGYQYQYNNPIDTEVEGDVAWQLAQLSRLHDPASGEVIGKAGLVKVLRESPGSIHSIGEFEQALARVYPQMKISALDKTITSAKAAARRGVPWNKQVAWARAEVRAGTNRVRTLEQEIHRARAIAADTPKVCRGPDCNPTYVALTRPYRLQAVLHCQELALRRIRAEIDQREAIAARFGNGTITEWYSESKRDYLDAVWASGLGGLRHAAAACSGLARSDDGRRLVQRLRSKIAAFEQSKSRNEPPPLHWQPQLLVDEPIRRVDSR